MIPSIPVKEPVTLAVLFLLAFVFAALVFSVLDLCASWGYSAGAHSLTLGYAIQRFPRSLFLVMIPSVVTALVLAGFRMARRPVSRFLGLAVCLAVGYVVLVNGMLWLRGLAREAAPPPAAARQYARAGTFLSVGNSMLNAQAVEGNDLRGILLYDPGSAERFSVYPRGGVTEAGGNLTVRLEGAGQSELTGKASSAFSSLFAPDAVTGLFLRDINALSMDYEGLVPGSLGEFFLACFALLFLCTASLAILRFTRWPLINLLFLVVAVRGYFLLYHFLAVDLRPEVARAIADPTAARIFPSAVFILLGILFLMIDILFLPAAGRLEEASP
jgi:hypothetical protein